MALSDQFIYKGGVRRVRTAAGAKKYGVPIGTPISAAQAKNIVRRSVSNPRSGEQTVMDQTGRKLSRHKRAQLNASLIDRGSKPVGPGQAMADGPMAPNKPKIRGRAPSIPKVVTYRDDQGHTSNWKPLGRVPSSWDYLPDTMSDGEKKRAFAALQAQMSPRKAVSRNKIASGTRSSRIAAGAKRIKAHDSTRGRTVQQRSDLLSSGMKRGSIQMTTFDQMEKDQTARQKNLASLKMGKDWAYDGGGFLQFGDKNGPHVRLFGSPTGGGTKYDVYTFTDRDGWASETKQGLSAAAAKAYAMKQAKKLGGK